MSSYDSAVGTRRVEDALVLRLTGGGLEAATALHGELEDALGAGRRRVVVDVALSHPLELTVVGVLLAGLRRLDDADGKLVLLAPSSGVPLEGQSVALDDYFHVEHSLSAAIAATAS